MLRQTGAGRGRERGGQGAGEEWSGRGHGGGMGETGSKKTNGMSKHFHCTRRAYENTRHKSTQHGSLFARPTICPHDPRTYAPSCLFMHPP